MGFLAYKEPIEYVVDNYFKRQRFLTMNRRGAEGVSLGHGAAPDFIYRWEAGQYKRVPNPDHIPGSHINEINGSLDAEYIACGVGNWNDHLTIYRRDEDTDNFIRAFNAAREHGGGGVNGTAITPNGSHIFHATNATQAANRIKVIRRVGETWGWLPSISPSTAAAANFSSCDRQGIYFAVSINGTPFIQFYKRSGDTFTLLPNIAPVPLSGSSVSTFSADGQFFFIRHTATPFLSIYHIDRETDTFTRLATPAIIPASNGGISISGLR